MDVLYDIEGYRAPVRWRARAMLMGLGFALGFMFALALRAWGLL